MNIDAKADCKMLITLHFYDFFERPFKTLGFLVANKHYSPVRQNNSKKVSSYEHTLFKDYIQLV